MESTRHQPQSRTALIAGASGLVGSHCLRELLANEKYGQVISIGRRPLDLEHPKLRNEVVDFNRLAERFPNQSLNDVFCCLGTTIKKAGSQKKFREVDYTYVMNVARLAEKCGAQRLMLVSAIGADPDSSVFYSRTKGEVERDVRKLNIPVIHIFRPSLLLGDRKEFRLGEKIGSGLALLATPFLRGKLAKYHPVEGAMVARAMVSAANLKKEGIQLYEFPLISDLVNRNND